MYDGRPKSLAALAAIPVVLGLLILGMKYLANPCHHDGAVTNTWKNGPPSSTWTCLDGKREGPATYWFEDGGLREQGQFVSDRRAGDWAVYDLDGSLLRHDHWEHGNRVMPKDDP